MNEQIQFPCTICEKGNIIDLGQNYICDNIKSVDEKCRFNLFKNFMGVEITPEILKELFENGITRKLTLTKKDETQFTAALKLNKDEPNGKLISLDFTPETLSIPCPKCGRKINITDKHYSCQGYFENKACDFSINRVIASVEIPETDIEYLLANKETKEFYEFQGRKKDFLAKIIIGDEFNSTFKTEICKCPKCEKGHIIGVGKVFMCNINECEFFTYRNYRFKDISVKTLTELMNGDIVTIKNIQKKDKSGMYNANIKLADDFSIVSL